jgi:ABC-type transport system involved in cytochrome c biogenesis permease subunit
MPDFSYRSSRLVTVLCLLALFAVGWMCLPGLAYGGHWTDESVKLFQTLPVQESGRVKPLDTVARFLLLRLNGKRSVTIEEDGQRRSLSASEWLLNCLFYPDESKEYAHFSVDSYELITAIGLMPHGKKRDRYSYGELEPALDRLYALAQEASLRPEDGRALVDQQLLALANNILLYEEIVHFLEFARLRLPVKESALLTELFPEEERVPLSQVVHKLPDHLQLLVSQSEGMDEATRQGIAADLEQLFGKLDEVGATARFLSFFPPFDRKEQEWMNPALYLEAAFTGMPEERVRGTLAWFETLVDNPQNTVVFEKTLKELHDSFVTEAQARGEYRRIPLEVHFYKGRYLFFSQWLFVVSFLLMAVSWTRPVDSRFTKLVTWSIVPPLLLLAIGITLRCIIRGRPPVTTLYETVLFTTLVAVALGFFVEFTSRNRIAVSVAALLGTFGMFFAWKYEASEAVDTMPAVIAVLDTNFWLATHVTTIIAGYGAGLFAAALAHVYFIFHVPLFKKNNSRTLRNLTSSIYGVMTFSLVFTLIGTVLGGVWAAQSWGRFWGWDPKENGALMIVLWILAILHARRGGYIKARGLAVSALLLGMIVVFAWWGVNALGVGLHSYGFTTGIWRSLALFWIVETFCIAAAFAISILFPVTAEKTQLPEKA